MITIELKDDKEGGIDIYLSKDTPKDTLIPVFAYEQALLVFLENGGVHSVLHAADALLQIRLKTEQEFQEEIKRNNPEMFEEQTEQSSMIASSTTNQADDQSKDDSSLPQGEQK